MNSPTETAPLKLFGPQTTDARNIHRSDNGLSPSSTSEALETQSHTSVDDIIEEIGIGKFHYVAAAVCGLGNASDAVELLCVSFILPSFGDEIDDSAKSALSAAVFVGMLVGGLLAGSAADSIGRRPMLAISLAINAIFGFISVFSPSWQLLAASRVIAGIGVGGSIPGVFSLYTEFLPVKRRGFFISLIAAWWMIGQIFTAAMAWIIIGKMEANWRVFAAVCSIPAAAASVLTMLVLPESPRFCMAKGDAARCATALQYMAKLNSKTIWANPSDEISWISKARAQASHLSARPKATGCLPRLSKALEEAKEQLVDFFHPSIRKTSIALLILWFCLSFGWYGLVLWIPTLFKEVHLDLDPYQDSFIVTAANLPGNIIAAVFMDRIGRKWMMLLSLLGACGAALLFAFAKTKALVICAACLLNAISVGSWNALDCLSTESFPTSMRTSSMGFLAAGGRMGSIAGQLVFGAMIAVSIPALLSTAAGILLIGALVSYMLPKETANMQLTESLGSFKDEGVLRSRAPSAQGIYLEVAPISSP